MAGITECQTPRESPVPSPDVRGSPDHRLLRRIDLAGLVLIQKGLTLGMNTELLKVKITIRSSASKP